MNQFNFKSLTNITDDEFSFKWDGKEIVMEKGETIKLEDYMADHGAKHMAIQILSQRHYDEIKTIAKETGKDIREVRSFINPHKGIEHDKIVAMALGVKKVDYTGLTKEQLIELATKEGLEVKQTNGRFKVKDQLIKELNEINN